MGLFPQPPSDTLALLASESEASALVAKAKVETLNALPPGEYSYSASQVSTFRDCKRKWAFGYIDRIKAPANKYAAAGDRIHAKIEEYLLTGKVGDHLLDDDMKIILPGVKYLPRPGTARVEQGFVLLLPGLGRIVGYIDAEFVEDDGIPTNIDHKTTSDLRWAMKPEQLLEDPQSVIYAVHTLEKHNVDQVRNRWVYYQRNAKRPAAKKVEVIMELAHVANQWQGVLATLEEMKRLHDSGQKAKSIEYNAAACDKYGGCPYIEICGLSSVERMRSFVMNVSMKERVKAATAAPPPAAPPGNPLARLQAAAVTPTTPAPVAQVVPTAPPAAAGGNPLARLKAQMPAAAAPVPPAAAATPQPTPPPAAPVAIAPGQVNPPENPLARLKAQMPAASAAAVQQTETAAAALQSFENMAARVTEAQALAEATPQQQASFPAEQTPWTRAGGLTPEVPETRIVGMILYVNCLPLKGPRPVPFSDVLQHVLAKVVREHNVPHYRLIPDTFGGAPAIMQTYLSQVLGEMSPGAVYLDLGSPEAKDAYSYLEEQASEVIRGF
jgi:hypothetical protein